VRMVRECQPIHERTKYGMEKKSLLENKKRQKKRKGLDQWIWFAFKGERRNKEASDKHLQNPLLPSEERIRGRVKKTLLGSGKKAFYLVEREVA